MNPKSRLAVLGEYVQFIVTISSASKEYAVSAFITVSGEMFHSIRLVARVILGMDIESTTSTESSSKGITFVPISVVTLSVSLSAALTGGIPIQPIMSAQTNPTVATVLFIAASFLLMKLVHFLLHWNQISFHLFGVLRTSPCFVLLAPFPSGSDM
jgi:hypothetical protein